MFFENQLLKSPSALGISRPGGDTAVHNQPTSGICNRSILHKFPSFVLVFCCCYLIALNCSNMLSGHCCQIQQNMKSILPKRCWLPVIKVKMPVLQLKGASM